MHKIMQFSPFPVRPCNKPKYKRRYERLIRQFITKPYKLNLVFQTFNLKMVVPTASKSHLVFSHPSVVAAGSGATSAAVPSDNEAASLSQLHQKLRRLLCPWAASKSFNKETL